MINITLIIYGKIGPKGAILNHQSKYIRQIANKILIKIASDKRKGENAKKSNFTPNPVYKILPQMFGCHQVFYILHNGQISIHTFP